MEIQGAQTGFCTYALMKSVRPLLIQEVGERFHPITNPEENTGAHIFF